MCDFELIPVERITYIAAHDLFWTAHELSLQSYIFL